MSAEAPLMALLAMASVGLWTLRVAVAARGMKLAGAIVASVEGVIFALTFSHLVTDLSSPDRLVGYAVGVAVGTALGLVANEHLTPGHTELHLVSSGDGGSIVESLRERHWPATWSSADGPKGAVTQVWVTVDDQQVGKLVADVQDIAPDAFWTLRRLAGAHATSLPEGCRQVTARRAV